MIFRRRGTPRVILRRFNPNPNEYEEKKEYSAKTNDQVHIDGKYETEIIGAVLVPEGEKVRSKNDFSEFIDHLDNVTYGSSDDDYYYRFFENQLYDS